MSDVLLWVFQQIWGVLQYPWGWICNLTFEWKLEIFAFLAIVLLRARIVEQTILSNYTAREWWADFIQEREWYRYARMSDRQFRARLENLRRKAKREDERATELRRQANGSAFLSSTLNERGDRHSLAKEKLDREALRLEALRVEIDKQKAARAKANGGGNDNGH